MHPISSKPASLAEAIETGKEILKRHSSESSWLGKKIFLGYNNETGWKIYELNLFDRFLRVLDLDYQDTHRHNVIEKLSNLTEKNVLNIGLLIEGMPGLQKKLKKIDQSSVDSLQKNGDALTHVLLPVISPLYLNNYKASRCYIDSVLEIMLSQDSIRLKIYQQYNQKNLQYSRKDISPQLKESLGKEKKILKKLIYLIESVDKTKEHGNGIQSTIGKNSPAEKIREAIFLSKLNYDLSDVKKIYTQQDAAAVLLLINDLLDNSFETVEVDKAVGVDDVIAKRPSTINLKLEIPLEKGYRCNLSYLIDKSFTQLDQNSTRKFELEGETIDLPYTTQTQLLTLPDSLTLQLSRYEFNLDMLRGEKLTEPVVLPEDGIVDLKPYFAGKKSEICQYEITGYTIHKGNYLDCGHYIANVKIGDKFYTCDDMKNPPFREISKEAFYGNQNAYLVMLKKIID